ncbi:MAG: 6-bladed beta-propeller, partial [bacterium]|nr:6-bladed beta-propeller [bacterium]
MAEHEVFLKDCVAFEPFPEENRVYFLDKEFCCIFVVELSSGRLLKTIGSRGQGPQELTSPVSMCISGGKIYVLDRGFNGFKIFDTMGNFITERRLSVVPSQWTRIDIRNDEIYLGYPDKRDHTMVSVYNDKGRKIRSLAPYTKQDVANAKKGKSRLHYFMNLDSKGNVILLHFLVRKICKYDSKGQLLWQSDVKNNILDKYSPENDYYHFNGKIYRASWAIFDLDVDADNSIIVGHASGGCVFDGEGALAKQIRAYIPYKDRFITSNLRLFRVRHGLLMNVLRHGKSIDSFNIKEKSR